MAIKPVTNQNALNKSQINREEQTSIRNEKGNARVVIRKEGGRDAGKAYAIGLKDIDVAIIGHMNNIMKPKRSHLIKSKPVEAAIDTSIDNVYGEPQPDRFDEIIDLLKQGNIYGETKDITMGAVEVPIVKQITIDKASTKGLKSEEYKNTSESKVDKLRKLRSGN